MSTSFGPHCCLRFRPRDPASAAVVGKKVAIVESETRTRAREVASRDGDPAQEVELGTIKELDIVNLLETMLPSEENFRLKFRFGEWCRWGLGAEGGRFEFESSQQKDREGLSNFPLLNFTNSRASHQKEAKHPKMDEFSERKIGSSDQPLEGQPSPKKRSWKGLDHGSLTDILATNFIPMSRIRLLLTYAPYLSPDTPLKPCILDAELGHSTSFPTVKYCELVPATSVTIYLNWTDLVAQIRKEEELSVLKHSQQKIRSIVDRPKLISSFKTGFVQHVLRSASAILSTEEDRLVEEFGLYVARRRDPGKGWSFEELAKTKEWQKLCERFYNDECCINVAFEGKQREEMLEVVEKVRRTYFKSWWRVEGEGWKTGTVLGWKWELADHAGRRTHCG
ncbi:hypothetical protein BJ508DRAFT_311659 [Ascobolus immersus RN42]|uniref:Uncharacterized protein n=1 Tax=Ascobolus immersus RN42 TaxID=1160509 RepID=A0A3N4HVH4_ASCIM|nr:hypothetical protein BJ508DRAFT_311659 [Ascobolus immersus RN42]